MSDSDRYHHGNTSPSLLDRLRSDEEEAWRRFVYLYGPLVDAWCRLLLLQPADVADVCQEVYRCVGRGIAAFRPAGTPGSFRAWLRTITRNCALEYFRHLAQQPQGVGGSDMHHWMQELPDLVQADEDFEAAQTVALVRRGLELIRPEFSASTWDAFSLVSLEGIEPAEVGRRLSLSVFAVRQACYRVRRRLRVELRDLES